MESWVGPAIIAALISGVISLLGLYLGGVLSIRHEQRRRREKVRDFQIALRAEIRSDLHNLMSVDFDRHYDEIAERYAARPGYVVFPSHPARHVVFEAIRSEIQILPEPVIDVVVLYFRQRHAIEKFVDDMHEERFGKLEAERQLEMYRDYIAMQEYLRETARLSVAALDRSLNEAVPLNTPASDRSGP